MDKKKIFARNGINYPNYIKINRNSSTGNTKINNNNITSKYLNKENYSKNMSLTKKENSGSNSKRNEETTEKLIGCVHKKYQNNNEPIKTGLTFESLLFNKENKHNEIKQNIINKEKNSFIYHRKHKNKSLDNLESFKRENILYYNNNKIYRGKLLFEKGKNYNKTLNLDESILNKKNINSKNKIHLSDRNTIEKKDLTFENFLSFREDNIQRERYNFENYNNIKNKKEEKYINEENKNNRNKIIDLSSLTELDNRILNLERNIKSFNLNDLITEQFSIFKLNHNNNELENYDNYNIQKLNDNFYNEINQKLKNIEEILLHKKKI